LEQARKAPGSPLPESPVQEANNKASASVTVRARTMVANLDLLDLEDL
jgi:hypothetical protein